MVIIDTSIWIDAYKRRGSAEHAEVARLVAQRQAAIVGIIFAEVIRGSRDEVEFDDLQEELLGATYVDDAFDDWLLASRILIDLKRRGLTIPLPDALIAALALRGGHTVYTHDEHFHGVPGLELHEVP